MNDLSSRLPLTRTERNEGVKYLLRAGWTQERIGKAAGVHYTSIFNIQKALTARGQAKTGPSRGGRPKNVAVLPKDVAARNDTARRVGPRPCAVAPGGCGCVEGQPRDELRGCPVASAGEAPRDAAEAAEEISHAH